MTGITQMNTKIKVLTSKSTFSPSGILGGTKAGRKGLTKIQSKTKT